MGGSCWTQEGGGVSGCWTVGGVTVPPTPEVGPNESGGANILLIDGRGELEKAIRPDERVDGVANAELSLGEDKEKFEEEEE